MRWPVRSTTRELLFARLKDENTIEDVRAFLGLVVLNHPVGADPFSIRNYCSHPWGWDALR